MLIAVKSKRFSVTGYKRMFVILIKKTLGSGFKYSAFDYCDIVNTQTVRDSQQTTSSIVNMNIPATSEVENHGQPAQIPLTDSQN